MELPTRPPRATADMAAGMIGAVNHVRSGHSTARKDVIPHNRDRWYDPIPRRRAPGLHEKDGTNFSASSVFLTLSMLSTVLTSFPYRGNLPSMSTPSSVPQRQKT